MLNGMFGSRACICSNKEMYMLASACLRTACCAHGAAAFASLAQRHAYVARRSGHGLQEDGEIILLFDSCRHTPRIICKRRF